MCPWSEFQFTQRLQSWERMRAERGSILTEYKVHLEKSLIGKLASVSVQRGWNRSGDQTDSDRVETFSSTHVQFTLPKRKLGFVRVVICSHLEKLFGFHQNHLQEKVFTSKSPWEAETTHNRLNKRWSGLGKNRERLKLDFGKGFISEGEMFTFKIKKTWVYFD